MKLLVLVYKFVLLYISHFVRILGDPVFTSLLPNLICHELLGTKRI